VSSFAEARAAASGADSARRAACRSALLSQAPSVWREESIRLLLRRALADGDDDEADRLASALPLPLALEERLVYQARHDPVGALTAAGGCPLPARAWQSLLWTCAAGLSDVCDPMVFDLLAGALCAALAYLPPAVAFLEAVELARRFADEPRVDVFHLLTLSTTPGFSQAARADLLLALGAALAVRGASADSAAIHAEAALLAGEARRDRRRDPP
jgi:hypothetical protein